MPITFKTEAAPRPALNGELSIVQLAERFDGNPKQVALWEQLVGAQQSLICSRYTADVKGKARADLKINPSPDNRN